MKRVNAKPARASKPEPAEPPEPVGHGHCIVCFAVSAEPICAACSDRIRAEAIEQKRELEKKGRI